MINVLVACEFSGVVRDAFCDRGYYAMSCDLEGVEPEGKYIGQHLYGDVRWFFEHLVWDLMIAHPPCTYLSSSGLHWNKRRPSREQQTTDALSFVRDLMNAPIERIAIENPIGRISTAIRRPEQIIQPWYFGDDASKATCLWLKNLPPLQSRNPLPGDRRTRRANQTPSGQNKLGPSPERSRERARTYPGIANAMAEQWGRAAAEGK
jgi:hypothetical protein